MLSAIQPRPFRPLVLQHTLLHKHPNGRIRSDLTLQSSATDISTNFAQKASWCGHDNDKEGREKLTRDA